MILFLDYKASKPVTQFLGSINDDDVLRQACAGVHCVMHIASLIDVSMFPNMDNLERVNVKGVCIFVLRPTIIYSFLSLIVF